jgi:outer membrane protein OmpA-like peptidoglycan-associated protein
MAAIFISYRRDDTSGIAGRLGDHLGRHLSRDSIFIDVDAMKPGVDFVKQLETQVSQCDVLLAVIGRHWLSIQDENGRRRLLADNDFVRIEIASALERDILVIPVLVDGTAIPSPSELPDDLKALSRRQSLELRNSRFRADADGIVHALNDALGRKGSPKKWPMRFLLAGMSLACIAGAVAIWLLLPEFHRRDPSPSISATPTEPTVAAAPPVKNRGIGNETDGAQAKSCQANLDAATSPAPITFEPGGTQFATASLPTLQSVARAAIDCTGVLIEVQGHSDAVGADSHNMNLTLLRAQAVVRTLVEMGVQPGHLRAAGYGATRPLVPNDTLENRVKNRRIQFVAVARPEAAPNAPK